MSLSKEELERYTRNMLVPQIGEAGQEKLKRSSVLVIGVGGVGSICALYLAAVGIGTIGIADGDTVALSNLQRQILYNSEDLGRVKVEAAGEVLSVLNPNIVVHTYPEYLTFETAKEIAKNYDFVIDAADGLPTKLLLGKACAAVNKPVCHGGLRRFRGQIMTCLPERNCFSCIFDDEKDHDLPAGGTIGPVCGIVGSLQVSEAVKYLLGVGTLLTEHVLYFDLLENSLQKVCFCKKEVCDAIGYKGKTI